MYDIRKAEWIKDDIEFCKKRVEEIRDRPHNYGEMCTLLNNISIGISYLHEGDVTAHLSEDEKRAYMEYAESLSQFILNAKQCIRE